MRRHDERVEEVRVVEKIMRFLHSRFDYIAVEVEESNKLEEILVEELQDSIQVYEERGLRKKKEDVWSKHCKPTLPKRCMASQLFPKEGWLLKRRLPRVRVALVVKMEDEVVAISNLIYEIAITLM